MFKVKWLTKVLQPGFLPRTHDFREQDAPLGSGDIIHHEVLRMVWSQRSVPRIDTSSQLVL